MLKVRKNLRKVIVTTAICLAGSVTLFAQETGVVINGVTWATRNVGAPKTFVTNPEDAGMFYQWNRPTAWTAGSVSGWDISNPTGTTWETANDPSPAGWRVPTKAELQSLLNTTYVTQVWTTLNGINGRRFTDIATGNSIFLPAAGYLDRNNGSLLSAGSTGLYWSNTANNSDDAGYLSLGMSTSAAAVGNSYRTSGLSVRCVKSSSTGINEVSADTENAIVTGYFDILGRKLTEEPTKGLYIIQYDNGKTKKMMK